MNLILCEAPVRFVATRWSNVDVIKASFLALRVGTMMSFSNNAQLHCMISLFRSQARNAYMIGKTLRGLTIRRELRLKDAGADIPDCCNHEAGNLDIFYFLKCCFFSNFIQFTSKHNRYTLPLTLLMFGR
ncbi:hypothetical protein Peur_032735 [Populus x canadensis]